VVARSQRSSGSSARHRRMMGSGGLQQPAWTEVGRGRHGPTSAGSFITCAEDDATTGGSLVGDIA
jgi:hypothetical protein